MDTTRDSDRVVFASIGIVDGKSEKISCILENISAGGALISMCSHIPETLQEGDIIHLKTILLSPVELRCKVTRIEAGRIAVQFLDI